MSYLWSPEHAISRAFSLARPEVADFQLFHPSGFSPKHVMYRDFFYPGINHQTSSSSPHPSTSCTQSVWFPNRMLLTRTQCSGSVTFWYGSGSGSGSLDPYMGSRIRIWIRFLPLSSVAFEMPTKVSFLQSFSFL
jgi:hypothetical protein